MLLWNRRNAILSLAGGRASSDDSTQLVITDCYNTAQLLVLIAAADSVCYLIICHAQAQQSMRDGLAICTVKMHIRCSVIAQSDENSIA